MTDAPRPQDDAVNRAPLDLTRLWAGGSVTAFGRAYLVEQMIIDGDRLTFTIALDGREVE